MTVPEGAVGATIRAAGAGGGGRLGGDGVARQGGDGAETVVYVPTPIPGEEWLVLVGSGGETGLCGASGGGGFSGVRDPVRWLVVAGGGGGSSRLLPGEDASEWSYVANQAPGGGGPGVGNDVPGSAGGTYPDLTGGEGGSGACPGGDGGFGGGGGGGAGEEGGGGAGGGEDPRNGASQGFGGPGGTSAAAMPYSEFLVFPGPYPSGGNPGTQGMEGSVEVTFELSR